MVSKAGLTVVLYGQAPDTAVFRDFRAKLKSLVDKNKIKLVWLDGGVTASRLLATCEENSHLAYAKRLVSPLGFKFQETFGLHDTTGKVTDTDTQIAKLDKLSLENEVDGNKTVFISLPYSSHYREEDLGYKAFVLSPLVMKQYSIFVILKEAIALPIYDPIVNDIYKKAVKLSQFCYHWNPIISQTPRLADLNKYISGDICTLRFHAGSSIRFSGFRKLNTSPRALRKIFLQLTKGEMPPDRLAQAWTLIQEDLEKFFTGNKACGFVSGMGDKIQIVNKDNGDGMLLIIEQLAHELQQRTATSKVANTPQIGPAYSTRLKAELAYLNKAVGRANLELTSAQRELDEISARESAVTAREALAERKLRDKLTTDTELALDLVELIMKLDLYDEKKTRADRKIYNIAFGHVQKILDDHVQHFSKMSNDIVSGDIDDYTLSDAVNFVLILKAFGAAKITPPKILNCYPANALAFLAYASQSFANDEQQINWFLGLDGFNNAETGSRLYEYLALAAMSGRSVKAIPNSEILQILQGMDVSSGQVVEPPPANIEVLALEPTRNVEAKVQEISGP
ncbi:MAG: hypothetical protein WAU72_06505 [Acidimicrobiia bacterium]